MAPADGGPGLPGRRPALPASDGAVEALSGPALLPLAVRRLVRVPRGGLSEGETQPELTPSRTTQRHYTGKRNEIKSHLEKCFNK